MCKDQRYLDEASWVDKIMQLNQILNINHGVILVGSMLILGGATTNLQEVLGFLAVILATLNVVGGFVVTDRMLEMFKPKTQKPKAPSNEELTQ